MERHIFTDADQRDPVELHLPHADAWLRCAKAPGKNGANEDSAGAWALPGVGFVLAIADGVGGAAGGARASGCAIDALDRAVATVVTGDNLRSAILDAFETANTEIIGLGIGAGTTLVVVEICERRLRSYHVGDSAAFVVGQRGRVKLETLQHSPVGYGVAAGLIKPGAALDRADRHLIANYLGTPDMHIELGPPIKLAARDSLLLASDGLLDNLRPDEIFETIRVGAVAANARELVARAERRMGSESEHTPSKPDDMSFILFRQSAAQ